MSRSEGDVVRHILDEADYLVRSSMNLSKEQFLSDETLKRAFIRSIEIIGEAARGLPDDFKRRFPRVEWRAIVGMRDKLIHGYFSVDYDIVWDVAQTDIPFLRAELEKKTPPHPTR